MLIGKNLSKIYNGKPALKNINIEIKSNQISVLIGPSGSGKTTLLRILGLIDTSDTGEVILDGVKYNGNEKIKPWPKISLVFQQLFLWPHLTLKENILLPLNLNYNGELGEDTSKLIDLFEMYDFIDRYPNEVSIGERQRAALVRALALKPSYLLLDEITSALDIEQVSVILSSLEKLKNAGIGILIITHSISFANKSADRSYFMDDGGIIESGGKELLINPKNARVRKFLSVIKSTT